MARIDKADYPAIVRMVDTEHRQVAEVAAQYGCTPAAIYALLARARRAAPAASAPKPAPGAGRRGGAIAKRPPPGPAAPAEAAPAPGGADLFAAAPAPEPAPEPDGAPADPAAAAPAGAAAVPAITAEPTPAAPAAVPLRPGWPRRRETERGTGVGARLARPGMGLLMRTEDGEETMMPFRSLEDLLAAIRPVLRGAARSPEPVWFSIRPVDLAAVESDAA